jgi:hypothetical protein
VQLHSSIEFERTNGSFKEKESAITASWCIKGGGDIDINKKIECLIDK